MFGDRGSQSSDLYSKLAPARQWTTVQRLVCSRDLFTCRSFAIYYLWRLAKEGVISVTNHVRTHVQVLPWRFMLSQRPSTALVPQLYILCRAWSRASGRIRGPLKLSLRCIMPLWSKGGWVTASESGPSNLHCSVPGGQ
jgi:hypothetical protein